VTDRQPSSGDLGEACGCCEGLGALTPVEVTNRPGLTAVAYRVGTHAAFNETMRARLSDRHHAALARLQTRDQDDFAISLLDAWSTVADVLTFYQERIANESYLRTATERRSISELARLIGYQLQPGVAASTYLAFTLEEAPGAPDQAAQPTTIDAGTQVQSVPGPGESPQVFETIQTIDARVRWNAIRPRLTMRHPVDGLTNAPLLFQGLSTNLRAGDGLLLFPDDGKDPMYRQVAKVVPDAAGQRTEVLLEPPPTVTAVAPPPSKFAVQAGGLGAATVKHLNQTLTTADLRALSAIEGFKAGDVFANLTATRPAGPSVQAFRTRAAVFGHNAPRWATLPVSQRVGEWNPAPGRSLLDGAWKGRKDSWADGALNAYGLEAKNSPVVFLDQTYSAITSGSWAVLKSGSRQVAYNITDAFETSRADFAISAKVTRITLNTAAGLDQFGIRETTVFAQSEDLALARVPNLTPVAGIEIDLDGWVEDLFVGQTLIVSGELDGMRGVRASEVVTIANVRHSLESEGYTTIVVSPMTNAYVRQTVTIYANVALATHGQTVEDLLGSGDASQPHQKFVLRQPPLTYVKSSTPSGAESTLEVRVNDVRWHETLTLYGHDGSDRVFVTRIEDDGATTVAFGDNTLGSRLPTGRQNVRAKYRRGIGLEGLVQAGQLTLLLSRPLGVRAVLNPLGAEGAAARETLVDARANAPLTVMTLDRAVSLRDYEDFARAFAGVAKARAVWAWNGRTRQILVTVAGPDGADITPGGDTHQHLLQALAFSGDPFARVQVVSYRRALFRVGAKVKVDGDFVRAKVLSAVEEALRSRFAFAARAFCQPVVLSEVVAVMQSVAGVIAVDVDTLGRTDSPPALRSVLPAAGPMIAPDGAILAAELLTLAAEPLKLDVMA
jgi:predicted phage baseplate assembly protein